MKLNNLDASCYKTLSFYVKGDEERGFTKIFKIELKNAKREVGAFYVKNASDKWQEIVVPLNEFRGLSDLSSLREFTIVFEDRLATKKEGAIYIDDVYLK